MKRIWNRACLVLSMAACLLPPSVLASAFDDGIPLVNWTAPPYWSAPASKTSSSGSKHLLTPANPSLAFHAVTPCRIADTRGFGFTGAYGPPSLTANAPRNFAVTSPGTSCGIPAGAAAVSFNFAVTNLTANGNLVAYPMGAAAPTVSSLNWTPSEVAISNAAVIALGSDSITVFVNGPVGSMADLIIDVNGYYGADPVVTSLNGNSGALNLVPSGDITITPGAPNTTIGTNATALSIADTLVRRDPSGNFAAANLALNTVTTINSITAGGAITASGTITASGGYTQPGSGDTVKIIRGIFNGFTGAIVGGTGWTVTRNSAGDYTVSYATGFTDTPAFTVTPINGAGLFLTFTVIGTNSFHIITRAPNGTATDSNFVAFTLIGAP